MDWLRQHGRGEGRGQEDLIHRVAELLAADEMADSAFLGVVGVEDGASKDAAGAVSGGLRPGDCLGPYRLRSVLGEGGMGRVYLADQRQPIERSVALKVIKRGLDCEEVVARFDAERQILARLSHPHVARILDGGSTPDGRPYFAMEAVDGEPIDTYCDRRELDREQRLQLVMAVCSAVQHAHQKGIVHRDLKPSNVLVAEIDGSPMPKIIDFGIAKILNDDGSRPFRTQFGRVIGTPELMSPEQLAGDSMDIDSRTDIYALGVLLHLLLVGRLPGVCAERAPKRVAGKADLRGAGGATAARGLWSSLARELVGLGADRATTEATSEGERRGARPPRGDCVLHGDLAWIVDKAMAADREERYASCSELAADLGRFLRREPVLAGPPSAHYRLLKFVDRHRARVVAAGLALTLLLMLAVGLAVQSRRLEGALVEARAESARLEEVMGFLVDVFRVSDPQALSVGGAGASERTAREILDQGAERVLDDLQDPSVHGTLVETIAKVYGNLGEYGRQIDLLGASVRRRSSVAEPEPLALAETFHELGIAHTHAGNWASAERHLRAAIDLRSSGIGADHFETLRSRHRLARLWRAQGRTADSEDLLREVLSQLEAREKESGARPELAIEIAEVMRTLGVVLYVRERFVEAESFLRRARARFRSQLPSDDPRRYRIDGGLAMVFERIGRTAEAAELHLRTLEQREPILGSDHPEIAALRSNLTLVLLRQRRFDEAVETSRLSVEALRSKFGWDHPNSLQAAVTHAVAVYYGRDEALAMDLLADARERAERALEISSPELRSALATEANLLMGLGRWQEAEPALRRLLAYYRTSEEHPAPAMRMAALLGQTLCKLGRGAEGESLLEAALAYRLDFFGADHRKTRETWARLEDHYRAVGKTAELEAWRQRLEASVPPEVARGSPEST